VETRHDGCACVLRACRCEGNIRSCTVSAENSEFGDPCVNTYKYLQVNYSCLAAAGVVYLPILRPIYRPTRIGGRLRYPSVCLSVRNSTSRIHRCSPRGSCLGRLGSRPPRGSFSACLALAWLDLRLSVSASARPHDFWLGSARLCICLGSVLKVLTVSLLCDYKRFVG